MTHPMDDLRYMDEVQRAANHHERCCIPMDPVDEMDSEMIESSAEAGAEAMDRGVAETVRAIDDDLVDLDLEEL